jgi:hypothetical protein
MAKNAANLWSPSAYALWTAPFGTTLPTTLLANPGNAWYEIGVLSDAGIAETRNVNENKIYDMVGQLQRIIRNQEERPFTFTALEDNRAVRELRYPGSTLTTVAGTAEVQSLTVTATGGTIQLSGGYGGVTGTTSGITVSGLSATALQTAIRTLPGYSTVTVSGAGPYTITFPASEGDVAALTVDTSAATGGSATVSTTTPGVASTNSRAVGSGTGRNNRAWYAYATDGLKAQAFVFANAEAVQSGTVGLTSSGVKASDFTLNPYPDGNGNFFYLLDNDAAQSVAFA